ncbi:MAG TPA: hypothetical protein VFG14_07040 [Chthoniobacteraceae bacterium]|nr:hypothetical protein [Chthoniobacteraceae bacterium]
MFIWLSDGDTPVALRLCYDRGFQERAITWDLATGIVRHDIVDRGTDTIESHGPTPILIAHGKPVSAKLAERFRSTPGDVPVEFRQLVVEGLDALVHRRD